MTKRRVSQLWPIEACSSVIEYLTPSTVSTVTTMGVFSPITPSVNPILE